MIRTVLLALVVALSAASSNLIAREPAESAPTTPEFYSQIAPYINGETSFVARANFAQFDFAVFSQTILDGVRGELERIGVDASSRTAALDAVKGVLVQAEATFEIRVADVLATTETTDLFVVGATDDADFWPLIVVPTAGKSDAALDALRSFVDENAPFETVAGPDGALVFSPGRDADETEAFLNAFVAAPNAKLERSVAASAEKNATISVCVAFFPFAKIVAKNPEAFDSFFASCDAANVPVKALVSQLSQVCRGASFALDLNRATSDSTLEFPDDESAAAFLKTLETVVDGAVDSFAARFNADFDFDSDADSDVDFDAETNPLGAPAAFGRRVVESASVRSNGNSAAIFAPISPLQRELYRGFARSAILPQRRGALLVSDANSKSGALCPIVGVVGLAAVPAAVAAQEAARRMQCMNNLKQIVLAFHNYHDSYGSLPSDCSKDADGKPLHSWRVAILPFIGETALYDQIRLDEPWDSEWNAQFHDKAPAVYQCPAADLASGTTTYSVIVGDGSVFSNRKPSLAQIVDGTSNTLAVVERKKAVCWMDPTQEFSMKDLENGFDQDADDCLSGHKDGANAAFFDGSVRFLSSTIELSTLKALATPRGGEPNVESLDDRR